MMSPNRSVARDNARFRDRCLSRLPLKATQTLSRESAAIEDADGYVAANRFVGTRSATLKQAKTHIAFDNDEIEARARAAALKSSRTADFDKLKQLIWDNGFDTPTGSKKVVRAKTQDVRWWRRKFRIRYTRAAENAFRGIGFIHRHGSPYVSGDGYLRYQHQQRISREYLQRRVAVDQATGECFNLWQVSQLTVSNPKIRRTELMTRVAGLERLSIELGHSWIHVTLTCPSAFHAYKSDGSLNKQWTGTTTGHGDVGDARAWMQRQWTRARSALKRTSTNFYGLRCAEPHHDATPHWHLLIFASATTLAKVESVLRFYWMQEYSAEQGALLHRVSVTKADIGAGSAAGYVAKYISKNTDGQALTHDDASETDLSGITASQLVTAWSRIHGIRQFQEFGGPSITLWRELRRIKEDTHIPPIEAVRVCVNKPADYAAYIKALGGIEQCRKNPSVRTDKRLPHETDSAGRHKIKLTRYGEMPPPQVCGVVCLHLGRLKRIETRGRWTLLTFTGISEMSGVFSALGPVGITVRAAPGTNEPSTWSNPRETGTYGPQPMLF